MPGPLGTRYIQARYPDVVTLVHKSFGSDNHSGALPEVVLAMSRANQGDAIAYGDDARTAGVARELRSIFGASGAYFVFTGSAANVLAISLLVRPFEAVICAETSHLTVDECGATERIVGSKLLTVAAPDGKLTPGLIRSRLTGRGDEHHAQPRVVQIAQVTELGTCYSLDELAEIRDLCDQEGLALYVDGARLANAAAYLHCDLRDIARYADVLSFGGTKNGAIAAESVIVMRDDLLGTVPFQRKQQLQLASKMRFIAAQYSALLTDDLWLRAARHSNAMARKLAEGIADVPGVTVCYPVQSNAVFAVLSPDRIGALRREWTFHIWDERANVVRWMTAFDTTEEHVDEFVTAIRASARA